MGGRDDLLRGPPRRCSPAQAQLIAAALRRRVELCGVFVNAPLEQIVRDSDELGLTLVQLHGDEGPVVLRRGRAPHRRARDQGGPGIRPGRRARPRALPRRLPPARRARDRPRGAGAARRHRGDVRLGLAARAPLDGPADPQRRPGRRERRARRSRRRIRSRWTAPAAPRPRPGTRTRSGCAALLRAPSACSARRAARRRASVSA